MKNLSIPRSPDYEELMQEFKDTFVEPENDAYRNPIPEKLFWDMAQVWASLTPTERWDLMNFQRQKTRSPKDTNDFDLFITFLDRFDIHEIEEIVEKYKEFLE